MPAELNPGPVNERLRVKIGGMSCSFCAASISRGLTRMPGVVEANVSIAHGEAVIDFDPSRVHEAALRQTLLDLGYTIRDPRKVRAFEEQQQEIQLARRRLWTAAILTGLTLCLMALMWLHLVAPASLQPIMSITLPVLALATIFGPGLYILKMAYQSLRRRILNQHVLLEFGAFAGFAGGLLGLVGLYLNFPEFTLPAASFFAVATFITTYHILSGYTSLMVRSKASEAVERLLALQPDTAVVLRHGRELELPVDQVVVGDLVRVRPGEVVPVDGSVVEGTSEVNQGLVTGESLPVEKLPGAEVIGGSLNGSGTLVVQVAHTGQESFLQRVTRQVEEARAKKPALLQLVDRILLAYVPSVLTLAAIAFLIWTVAAVVLTGQVFLNRAIFATLAVLVMGYPCALGMATPLAMIRGGGLAAEFGILVRNGEVFQTLTTLDTVILDKTGTLTQGLPRVSAVVPIADYSDETVLSLAAAVEASSEHPLARAVVGEALSRGLRPDPVETFTALPGRGAIAEQACSTLLVGSPSFARHTGVSLSEAAAAQVDQMEASGCTVIIVAKDRRAVGLVALTDTVRPEARETVDRLRAHGLEPIMVTGDNDGAAKPVAQAAGIETYLAGVSPAGKADVVRGLQATGHRVMMVGDGINDAPALSQADVGLAMGAGTDIAIESADIVLMGTHLGLVAEAVAIGQVSYRKTVQNVSLAFAFNGIGVPLALSGLVDPSWAMVAMAASVSTVLANSFLRPAGKRAITVETTQSLPQ